MRLRITYTDTHTDKELTEFSCRQRLFDTKQKSCVPLIETTNRVIFLYSLCESLHIFVLNVFGQGLWELSRDTWLIFLIISIKFILSIHETQIDFSSYVDKFEFSGVLECGIQLSITIQCLLGIQNINAEMTETSSEKIFFSTVFQETALEWGGCDLY